MMRRINRLLALLMTLCLLASLAVVPAAAAGEIMQQYLAQAAGLLAGYEPSDYRTALIDLCAYVAERDR